MKVKLLIWEQKLNSNFSKICLKIDAPKNVYKNRHEAQTLIIETQKSKIQKQEQQIQSLINEKLHNSKKGAQNAETILRVDSPKEKKEKSLTEFAKTIVYSSYILENSKHFLNFTKSTKKAF